MKKKRLQHTLKPSRHERAIARERKTIDLLERLVVGLLIKTETGEVYLGQTDFGARELGYAFHAESTDEGTVHLKLIEPEEDDIVHLTDEPGFPDQTSIEERAALEAEGVVDFDAYGPATVAVQVEDGFVAAGDDGELVRL
jgi:hypothetical protein